MKVLSNMQLHCVQGGSACATSHLESVIMLQHVTTCTGIGMGAGAAWGALALSAANAASTNALLGFAAGGAGIGFMLGIATAIPANFIMSAVAEMILGSD